VWLERLAAGEIWCNGQQLWADGRAQAGDQLVWHRPPWQEAAVPVLPGPLFDDGDLVVINKPRGLPVLPAGGFLEHTLLAQLQQRHQADPLGIPRPVHRLGRFTSGGLVCARQPKTRAWLSAQLRESTGSSRLATAAQAEPGPGRAKGCRKLYRALVALPAAGSALAQAEAALVGGEALALTTAIGRQPHPRLGQLWCAAAPGDPAALAAHSWVRLLERRAEGWLVEVAIASGRPHQIRIHMAAAGAPLLGDPLYGVGGGGRPGALPGDGGYQLQAFRLELEKPGGGQLVLEVPEALGFPEHFEVLD
jgi:23S rRNA pseudouridine1911/1915/1917 synthase